MKTKNLRLKEKREYHALDLIICHFMTELQTVMSELSTKLPRFKGMNVTLKEDEHADGITDVIAFIYPTGWTEHSFVSLHVRPAEGAFLGWDVLDGRFYNLALEQELCDFSFLCEPCTYGLIINPKNAYLREKFASQYKIIHMVHQSYLER